MDALITHFLEIVKMSELKRREQDIGIGGK
jgi:hypothetical protein